MANLKGATFIKQIKNAKIRIEARGQSRHQKQEFHLTHSNALALKRDNILSSFSDYAASLNHEETKLNNYMTDQIVTNFLAHRTASLSKTSAENFTRGFSALTDALKSTGITINVNKNTFDTFVQHNNSSSKEDKQDDSKRDIQNLDEVIQKLNSINPSFAAIATLQSNLGIRVSEAIELYKNPSKYIHSDNTIKNLIGKGNHIYDPKPISKEIRQLLTKNGTVPYQTYQNALKGLNLTSHDMRYTFVKNKMEELLHTKNCTDSLKIVSKEINHNRKQITEYYLSKTSF